MWLDTFDWTVWRARAAAEKERWSATAASAASWRRSTGPSLSARQGALTVGPGRRHRAGTIPAVAPTRAAAFFDLDRTLLGKASGPAITTALRAAGVVPDRSIPGEGLIYRVFDVIGENLPSMLVTRQAARLANGWDRSVVQEAGRVAAEALLPDVLPYAAPAGRAPPRGGPPRRHGDDLALRPGAPAGRCARPRRRDRHPVRRPSRRLRRHHRRPLRLGAGQARRGARVGTGPRRRRGPELGLLRQHLRHAPPLGGGPPGRGEPRPSPR